MKKRLFFGFSLFVGLFLLVAWQVAAAELADLQTQPESSMEEKVSEVV